MFVHPALDKFTKLARQEHPEPSLFELSLLLAEGLGCQFDPDSCRAGMDRLEKGLRERLGNTSEPLLQLRILARYLAGEEKFSGNRERYYETDNSFLPRVLETRQGIPISLSIISIELGRRMGLAIRGVGLPGHFVCSHEAAGRIFYFDPFHGWKTITRDECVNLVQRLFGPGFEVTDDCFRPWSNRLIIERSLRNLKGVYLSRGDLESALKAVEFILAAMPDQGNEIRDRGLLRARLGKYGLAYEDLLRYLELSPGAPDLPQIQRELVRVKRQMETVN
ncbi:MAG: tetratricopeptide repeat protein [Deltaproteobacteria bacterium]|nr:tetratricopeptide repeat protein [Deltaproteobacteria bacterium]